MRKKLFIDSGAYWGGGLIFCLSNSLFFGEALFGFSIGALILFFGLWGCFYAYAYSIYGRPRFAVCLLGLKTLEGFLFSALLSFFYVCAQAFFMLADGNGKAWLINALVCVLLEAVFFTIGIICVYCTSHSMGIGLRVLGVAVGMIPIINLLVLLHICQTISEELRFEAKKEAVNRARAGAKLCDTRYPILLVHGVCFRDFKRFNYWGRIPQELERNGATVFYGNHDSAAAVADSAAEIAARIREILAQTGAQKLNIIAHSKGGLDCRYAIANYGMEPFVASLTTVNTPHRGCEFADFLLTRIPQGFQERVAENYRRMLLRLGDKNPRFLDAMWDLTASRCCERNKSLPEPKGIFCQSIGSIMPKPRGGQFPLNMTYHLVNLFDGPNDGLVGEPSFSWGERYQLVSTKREEGISHCDIIDMSRINLPDFDVREFYVQLVSDLRKRGF